MASSATAGPDLYHGISALGSPMVDANPGLEPYVCYDVARSVGFAAGVRRARFAGQTPFAWEGEVGG